MLAPQAVVDHINATVAGKLAFWGPKMGADKPAKTIVPQVLDGHRLTLEGQPLEVIGLDGPQPDRSFVWVPSIKAVVGGVVVADNIHLWMADTQSAQSHKDWLATLQRIAELQPRTVVPGISSATRRCNPWPLPPTTSRPLTKKPPRPRTPPP